MLSEHGAMGGRNDKTKRFGAAVVSARQARGLSQQRLGDLLGGKTQSTISAWEAGDAEPLPATVFMVEEVLGLPAGTLSGVLGYLPAREGVAVSSVGAAIAADPLLKASEKRGLLALYEAFTTSPPSVRSRASAKA